MAVSDMTGEDAFELPFHKLMEIAVEAPKADEELEIKHLFEPIVRPKFLAYTSSVPFAVT